MAFFANVIWPTAISRSMIVLCFSFLACWTAADLAFGEDADIAEAKTVDVAKSEELLQRFRDAIANSFSFRPKLDLKAFDFLEQFLEHREREKWSELFRLADQELDPLRNQMIVADDGVWITLDEYCNRVFRELPPAALDTVRLYIDARAKVAWKEARSTTNLELLTRMYRRFAISSYGDQFANELGDAHFQNGNYREAAELWRVAIDQYPTTRFSQPRMLLKRAIAFHRAGDQPRFQACLAQLKEQFGTAQVRIGGEDASAVAYASNLANTDGTKFIEPKRVLDLSDDDRWEWSTFWPEMARDPNQKGTAAFGANPEMCVVHLGHQVGGFDRRSGKLEWIVDFPQEDQSDTIENGRFGRRRILSNSSQSVSDLRYADPIEWNGVFFLRMRPTRGPQKIVVRAIESRTGRQKWESLEGLQDYQIISDPQPCNGYIFVLAKKKNSDQILLQALSLQDGSIAWSLPLGSSPPMSAFVQKSNEGRLEIRGHRLFVILEQAIISVDVLDRSIRWLYRIDPEKPDAPQGTVLNGNRVFLNGRIRRYEMVQVGSIETMIAEDEIFVFDPAAKQLFCLDDQRQTKRWSIASKRPAMACVYRGRLYALLQSELIAYDLMTGEGQPPQEVGSNFGNASLFGHELAVPTYDGVRVFDLDSGGSRIIQPLPDIGVVRRLFQDRNSAVAISRNKVTLFSLAP